MCFSPYRPPVCSDRILLVASCSAAAPQVDHRALSVASRLPSSSRLAIFLSRHPHLPRFARSRPRRTRCRRVRQARRSFFAQFPPPLPNTPIRADVFLAEDARPVQAIGASLAILPWPWEATMVRRAAPSRPAPVPNARPVHLWSSL